MQSRRADALRRQRDVWQRALRNVASGIPSSNHAAGFPYELTGYLCASAEWGVYRFLSFPVARSSRHCGVNAITLHRAGHYLRASSPRKNTLQHFYRSDLLNLTTLILGMEPFIHAVRFFNTHSQGNSLRVRITTDSLRILRRVHFNRIFPAQPKCTTGSSVDKDWNRSLNNYLREYHNNNAAYFHYNTA